jgi:hypothetical protein
MPMTFLPRCALPVVAMAASLSMLGCDRHATDAPGAGTTDATRNGAATGIPGSPGTAGASTPMGAASTPR